jgi:hypothetical protein
MIQLSNLNSLWELSFVIYVFYLFIDLFPYFEKRFPSIIYSYPSGLDDFLSPSEIGQIKICGFHSLTLHYADIKLVGLIASPICILASFVLLIIGCFSPNFEILYTTSIILLILLFVPFCYITYKMIFGLKRLKIKYVIKNLKYIRENTTDKDKIAKIDAFLAKKDFFLNLVNEDDSI